jgi:pyruvate/2-oxoglutarate dehydrogenase complex dihydrolipoamide acyltransferase (E2) component
VFNQKHGKEDAMNRLMGAMAIGLAMIAGLGAETAVAGLLNDLKKKAQEAVDEVAAEATQQAPLAASPSGASTSNAPNPAASTAPSGASGQLVFRTESGKPTMAARELAVVKFRPEALDDEVLLKRIAGNVDPSRRNWMNSDEFRWRREKDAIKAELLEQAKTVPTTFEITPWPGNPIMADLGEYDFDRQAFKMRVHIGASAGWPWGGGNRVQWLPVPPDVAEQMVAAFNNGPRLVYAKYTQTTVGVEIRGSGDRVYPYWDDRIDKVDVYTHTGAPVPTSPKDYVYRVSLDTHDFRMPDFAGRGIR